MNTVRLAWKLLRYRVAVMLILFLLLAAALHHKLAVHPWLWVVACLALACSYISATSSNDLADEKIDAINHPDSAGRPLITGAARSSDMWHVFGAASMAAALLGLLISWRAMIVIVLSIAINVLYSLPPARLSYRTFLAPLALGLAYVGIPYTLALVIIGAGFSGYDTGWLAGLYLMFVGRIILKDFRDRKGDAQHNKPTFLLRFGKKATCMTSGALIAVGGLLLAIQLRDAPWLAGITGAFIIAVAYMLRRLALAPVGEEEQVSIGVGAKMGNGLLITLLGYFALQKTTAPSLARLAIPLFLAALFFWNYLAFLQNPHKAVIGYKG